MVFYQAIIRSSLTNYQKITSKGRGALLLIKHSNRNDVCIDIRFNGLNEQLGNM